MHTLSKRLLKIAWDVTEEYLLEDKIPSRVGILIRDFISFKNKLHLDNIEDKLKEVRNKGGWFLKLMFHNKGIDMIYLPGILHNKKVLRTVPSFVQHIEPPIVSYSYTKGIRNIIFNHKAVIKDIDFGMGTSNVTCSCSSSRFLYTPANHVITGNLDIVKHTELHNLINKGPSFREQNNINWLLNRNLCLEAIRKYKIMWARRENMIYMCLMNGNIQLEIILKIESKH